jgi:antitoxin component YwqK of YwqJK toxin-antitoxin module
MTPRFLLLLIGIFPLHVRSQERNETLHTNFFYWGPVKETFSAYPGKDGKLVKHGRYRDWEEDGSLWREIDYKDGKVHGAMVTFYPNGQKASETAYAEGKPEGLSSTWNRDGVIVAQGTNRHGAPWSGKFANETRHSIRSRGAAFAHLQRACSP